MLFSACNIDSSSLVGNGWMTYQTTILDTTINGDTIRPTNNNFPIYFDMDLKNPNSRSYLKEKISPRPQVMRAWNFSSHQTLVNLQNL